LSNSDAHHRCTAKGDGPEAVLKPEKNLLQTSSPSLSGGGRGGEFFLGQLNDGEKVIEIGCGNELGGIELLASSFPATDSHDIFILPPATGGKDEHSDVADIEATRFFGQRTFMEGESTLRAEAFIHPKWKEDSPRPFETPSFLLVA